MSFLELPDGSRVDVFGSGGGEKLANETQVPFIGAIPMDPAVREGGDSGSPIVVGHPESVVARALKEVAEDIAAKVSIEAMKQENVIPIDMVG